MKHKVIACIPTKDTGWLLKRTLKHLTSFCDKVIIGDDQSTDDTEEVCRSYDNVEYYKRPPRDFGDRQGAVQRQELLERAYKHDPDYFFFLDADEMPSPDIVDWINSLNTREEEITCMWTFPWVHLWGDENHYRVDSYTSKTGAAMQWNPFKPQQEGWRKGFFVRNVPDFTLQYNVSQHRVRPSNQPFNTPEPWVNVVESPVIVHYGKISKYFQEGQNWKDRAAWDKYTKNSSPEDTMNHHRICNSEDTLQLREVKEEWVWE